MQYRTIRAAASAEFVEKRSRFIGYISPVTTQEDAAAFIDSIRSKHWDATHNVPAYIIREGNICRFSVCPCPRWTATSFGCFPAFTISIRPSIRLPEGGRSLRWPIR